MNSKIPNFRRQHLGSCVKFTNPVHDTRFLSRVPTDFLEVMQAG
jgi:hypothetical protein